MHHVVWWKLAGVSEVHTASVMAAVSTSETPVGFYQTTWCSIPENSHLRVTAVLHNVCHVLFSAYLLRSTTVL